MTVRRQARNDGSRTDHERAGDLRARAREQEPIRRPPDARSRAEIVGDERSLAVEQTADLIGLIIEALGVQSEQPPARGMRY
jgi:hypothetical protein